MRINGRRIICAFLLVTACGCSTGPIAFLSDDEVQCGPEQGSADWWAQQAMLPPGSRQKCKKGKMWPVQPRPTVPPQQFSHTYHSAHYWPLPYVCQDRQYVRDIVQSQVGNGWRDETTIYDRHFDEDLSLNVPGRLHLIDIIEVTPTQYRTVYVQSTYDAEVDNARVSNVEQQVAEITGGTEAIPVVLRRGRDYSRPASEVKIINDLYNRSTPVPRIGGGGTGSGGGGGIGGGGGGGMSTVPSVNQP